MVTGSRNVKHRCLVCGVPDDEKPMCFRSEFWCSEDHRKVIVDREAATKYPFEFLLMKAGVAIRTMKNFNMEDPCWSEADTQEKQDLLRSATIRHHYAAKEDKEELLPAPPSPQMVVSEIRSGNVKVNSDGVYFKADGSDEYVLFAKGNFQKEEASDNGVPKEWIG